MLDAGKGEREGERDERKEEHGRARVGERTVAIRVRGAVGDGRGASRETLSRATVQRWTIKRRSVEV